jgi:hypothetical protein
MPVFVDDIKVKDANGVVRLVADNEGNVFGNGLFKTARGTTTPTSAAHTVATGLTTVVAVVASFKGAPTLTHMLLAADVGNQAGAPAAGSFILRGYKPTAVGDVTPIAATTPWGAVDWIAIGT